MEQSNSKEFMLAYGCRGIRVRDDGGRHESNEQAWLLEPRAEGSHLDLQTQAEGANWE